MAHLCLCHDKHHLHALLNVTLLDLCGLHACQHPITETVASTLSRSLPEGGLLPSYLIIFGAEISSMRPQRIFPVGGYDASYLDSSFEMAFWIEVLDPKSPLGLRLDY